MILSCEDGFREVKVGRIFQESDLLEISGERGWIKHSNYEAYLGGHRVFCQRFEEKLDLYRPLQQRLVFITDGARWMQNWLLDAYPAATPIPDFYHAVEHLGEFAQSYFEDEKHRGQRTEQQKNLLWESKVEEVIENLSSLCAVIPKGKEPLKRHCLPITRPTKQKWITSIIAGWVQASLAREP
ncbi:MAG: hypothetical protein ICV53_09905 [Flavisolibacter sp.]|nr:hypothetical protein [Flavisolibacter sp.]